MKTYPLSLSRNYVARWGMAEAVRELIQNALDSDSPFTHEFDKRENGTISLRLQSAGVTIPPSMLLLGMSDKGDNDDAIGSFGEGFKLALLVLTREGFPVTIRNGNLTWTPAFEHSDIFGEEVLVIREIQTYEGNQDLIFDVGGLSDENATEIVRSCLLMQDEVAVCHVTSQGDILKDRPGELYVGNLFVCKTELTYGYNVKPSLLPLERDRQTVSSWDLNTVVLAMWVSTGLHDHIADMIDREVKDVQHSMYGGIPEETKRACYELFRKRHPHAFAAETQDQLDKMLRTNQSAVRVNRAMYSAVTGYSGYSRATYVETKTPTQRLEEFRDEHLATGEIDAGVIEEFDKLIEESKNWIVE